VTITTPLAQAQRAAVARLDALYPRLRTLTPCSRNPHRFHEEKSDILHEIAAVARDLMGVSNALEGRWKLPATEPMQAPTKPILSKGKIVALEIRSKRKRTKAPDMVFRSLKKDD
jgi:hypothetical protein